MSERLSFEDLVREESDTRYATVKTARGDVKLGSVSSEDILAWLEENDSEDKEVKRFSSLRLVVKSFIRPDETRIPKDEQARAVVALAKRDARENARLVKAALDLNGLKEKADVEAKNDSGEAGTDASPTS